jgi:hypothetical protein
MNKTQKKLLNYGSAFDEGDFIEAEIKAEIEKVLKRHG